MIKSISHKIKAGLAPRQTRTEGRGSFSQHCSATVQRLDPRSPAHPLKHPLVSCWAIQTLNLIRNRQASSGSRVEDPDQLILRYLQLTPDGSKDGFYTEGVLTERQPVTTGLQQRMATHHTDVFGNLFLSLSHS